MTSGKESHSFEAIAAYNFGPVGVNFMGGSEPERLTSLPVTAGFFRVLGVKPWLGHSFREAEDKPGAGHFAVISYPLWQRLFHGDRDVVGKAMVLNTASYTIVGVMPADFDFPQSADVWTPLQLKVDPADHANDYDVIARLKPDVSLPEAAQNMHVVAQRFRQQFGKGIMMSDGEDIGVHGLHEWTVGDVRPALLVLMGAVGFVLLIACANVANLLLARSTVRQQEMAVRTALGASGWQLMRLLFTESLLLSVAGGALGLVLAQLSVPLLMRLAPANLLQTAQLSQDWTATLFAGVVSLATGMLFGLFPAVHSARLGISNGLRNAGTRNATNASANRARKGLVVAEVAISLVLLVGAGLLMQTFKKLSGVDPGFNTQHVLTMQMSISDEKFRATAATGLLAKRIATRLEALPGVLAAGTITSLPTEPGFDDPFEIIGHPPSSEITDEAVRAVSPHYFSAMRIPIVAGRAFTDQDTQQAHRVIIVNEAFARKYFPHQNPLGQQLLVARIMGPAFADVPRQIVGVVGDTRDAGINQPPQPIYFEPVARLPDGLMALANQLVPLNWVIRTSGDPLTMVQTVRRETLTASGGVPMAEPRLLEQVIGASIARERFSMLLLGLFAGLAVLLCAIGLYGVVSYSVAQRTRELGIRAALGAGRADLLKLVIGQGMWLVAIGLGTGLIAASGFTRFLQGMLYGVSAFDPPVLATVTALLAAVALTACWFPARRAARLDSAIALREE